MKRIVTLSIAALVIAQLQSASLSASQSYSYSYGHISHLEGDVEIQRAAEPEPDEAGVNLPVMSGDRIWTRTGSRAEIQYGDGSILRMDERTRVDFVDFGEEGGEALVRLWSGSIILRLSEEQAKRFRLDSPAGTVYPASAGLFRIDVFDGGESTVLSVYEGVAELASESGSVLVRSGQRSIVEPGRRPEPSFSFNTARYDKFLTWSDDLDRRYARTEHIEGIPPEVEFYTGHLSHHGTWRVDVQLGPVWYPSVSVGWYPYSHGRWTYTWYGWTWVSYEPWGWAPYHYGRWGYNHFGWYWIPGAYWGPAWVSWAIGPTWIGWCPLGYYDRPVHHYDRIWYRGGKAVPRGSVVPHTRGHGWNFVRHGDFGTRSLARARLRTADLQSSAREARLLESGAVLDRSLRPHIVGAAAMTRLPKGGLAELRGSGTASREGGPSAGRTTASGALQTGRARSRTSPSAGLGSVPSPRREESSSTLRQSTPSASSSRSPAGARDRTERTDRTENTLGRPKSTRSLPGAIRRSTTPSDSSDRAGSLRQGSRITSRQPSSSPSRETETRSTVSRRFRESDTRERPPSSTAQRSSVQRSTRPEKSPRSYQPSSALRPTERSSDASRSRGLSSSERRSGSQSATRPSNPTGSSSGRDIFSRMTRTRPSKSAPRSSAPDRPAVRSSSPRPPAGSPPSRTSGSSSSSGKARARPKKKN